MKSFVDVERSILHDVQAEILVVSETPAAPLFEHPQFVAVEVAELHDVAPQVLIDLVISVHQVETTNSVDEFCDSADLEKHALQNL